MPADIRTVILDFVNDIIKKTKELNGEFTGGNDEDTAENLSTPELEILLSQIQEKSNRPRRPIGSI